MWSDKEKSTYFITALKGQAADVLAGIPINTPYEDTLQTLEDRFGDQHFAAAYRCQLSATKQKAGQSLQEFATAIELLAHRAYPTLPEDHIGREAAKAFAHGVDDYDIKIQLLLGGEKTINEAL
jgi:peptide subunit release factor 1 (eRF1)